MSFSIRRDVTYDDINAENVNVGNNGTFGGDIAVQGGDIASTATDFNLLRFDRIASTVSGPADITLGDSAAVVAVPGKLDAKIISSGGSIHGPSIEFLGAAENLPDPAVAPLLIKNKYYESNLGDSLVSGESFLLPTPDDSVAGDWIKYRNLEVTSDSDLITFGSADNEVFDTDSILTGLNCVGTGSTAITITRATGSEFSVVFEGKTDGSGGAGSEVTFVFNGTAWVVNGLSLNQGNGSAKTVGGSDAIRFAA